MTEQLTIDQHVSNLEKIIISCGEKLEGNCFYEHHTLKKNDLFKNKQSNIMNMAKKGNDIMEIGFNAGHSCLLMLMANPNCKITAIDICEHKYVTPCFKYLNEKFNNRVTLITGDSHTVLSKLHETFPQLKFDVIHIDGNHDYTHANVDFFLTKNLAIPARTICIFDDTNMEHLGELWKSYIVNKHITPYPEVLRTHFYEHSIGIYI